MQLYLYHKLHSSAIRDRACQISAEKSIWTESGQGYVVGVVGVQNKEIACKLYWKLGFNQINTWNQMCPIQMWKKGAMAMF